MGFKAVKHSEPSPSFQILFFTSSFLLVRKQWTHKYDIPKVKTKYMIGTGGKEANRQREEEDMVTRKNKGTGTYSTIASVRATLQF
jgi:hypothetical protein